MGHQLEPHANVKPSMVLHLSRLNRKFERRRNRKFRRKSFRLGHNELG